MKGWLVGTGRAADCRLRNDAGRSSRTKVEANHDKLAIVREANGVVPRSVLAETTKRGGGYIPGSFRGGGHVPPLGYIITDTTYFRLQLFSEVIECILLTSDHIAYSTFTNYHTP